MQGRVFRRCACRGPDGRQVGTGCPRLATDSRHGSWTFALEQPVVNGRRTTMRRSGFTTRKAAADALARQVERQNGGVTSDDRETVETYLTAWLVEQQRVRKPTTFANYARYVRADLIPALGRVPLESLTHAHVGRLVADLEAAGRGATTIRRIHAVLRSALGDAVRRRRLAHNPAAHAVLPEVHRVERGGWAVPEAIGFLAHVRDADDRDADLFETLIGTGLRKGEAIALRWSDVDLDARIAHVRQTLSSVDNARLVFTKPKTKGSAAGVGLSTRVVAALRRQRDRQDGERAAWGDAYADHGLIFCRENGEPLRPEYVLRRFRTLTAAAGLPRVRVHDLRHLAASMMIAAGVPLPIVSKTLRHSTVAITADVYSHMTADIAREAVDAMAAALDAAEAEAAATGRARAVLDDGPSGGPDDPVSADPALTHSHRTHNEEMIMDTAQQRPRPRQVRRRSPGAFPQVDSEKGGPSVRKNRPSRPSGRQDLNLRPLDPQSSALPSCATSRPPLAGHVEPYRTHGSIPPGVSSVASTLRTSATASSCDPTSSFASTALTCVRTVGSDTTKCSAMACARTPPASSSRTSRSRRVRVAMRSRTAR